MKRLRIILSDNYYVYRTIAHGISGPISSYFEKYIYIKENSDT